MTSTVSHEKLQEEILLLKAHNTYLQEQLNWFQRQLFGKRSEKNMTQTSEEQLLLDGFEPKEMPSEAQTVPAHSRRAPKRRGEDKITLPPDLPVETTILDLPEEEKATLVKIGEEITYKLAFKPGSYCLKKIIRPKYAYPKKEEGGIAIASLPDSIISRCRADESFLADLLTKKFADHLPLYRINEILLREGIGISRQLLSKWVIKLGLSLKPLYDEMLGKILESNNAFVDEVPVRLQEQNKKAYLWILVGGNERDPPYRVYDFNDSRSHSNAFRFLKDYSGVLHSDKYGAYEIMAGKKQITWCPCWSHIRRKFFESSESNFQKWVLRKIRYLFMLERIAWSRSEEERLQIRQEKETPIIDELIQKIKERLVKELPKSKLRGALGYFCGLIPYLKNYTQLAYARLDNNVAERAVRPIALGRKNWLFFGSKAGGKAGAIIFSLVQTCRGLGINPRDYLEDILRRFMSHPANKMHELLPDRWLKNRQKANPNLSDQDGLS